MRTPHTAEYQDPAFCCNRQLIAKKPLQPLSGRQPLTHSLATTLAKKVLGGLALTKIKNLAVIFLVVSVISAAAGVVAHHAGVRQQVESAKPMPALLQPPIAQQPKAIENRLDHFGDPLPAGVLARMGTVRFRHAGSIYGYAFLPDGKSIIAASRDGALCQWDIATGKPMRRFAGHGGPGPVLYPPSFALSLEGTRLAAPERSPTGAVQIHLWDVFTGKERPSLTLTAPENRVKSLTWSPDNKTLATAYSDGAVRIYDTDKAQELHQLSWHKKAVHGVAFSGDGTRIASCGGDGVIDVADLKNLEKPLRFQGREREYLMVAFSLDGKELISGGYCQSDKNNPTTPSVNTIAIWDAATGKRLREFEVGSVTKHARYEALDKWMDGQDRVTRQLMGLPPSYVANGKPAEASTTAWALAADRKTLAFGCWDHAVHLWDLATGKPLAQSPAILNF